MRRNVRRGAIPAASVLFVVTIALGFTSACGGGRSSPLSPTPLASPSRFAGRATAPLQSVAPTIEAVSPPSGPTTGGMEIVISGSGFAEGATVTLGAWPATNVAVLSDTIITAITSPHDEGTFDVTVINPDGQTATLPGAYTYVANQPAVDVVVTITSSGVTPKDLQVSVGSRVTFVNSNSRAHDIQSDPHPIHSDCPVLNEVGFIRPGESKQTGVFAVERACGYHDHNQSTNQALRGRIVVVPVSVAAGVR